MGFEFIRNFLKRRGVWDTLDVLGQAPNFTLDYAQLKDKLDHVSNYQAFVNVQKDLLKYGLIEKTYDEHNNLLVSLLPVGKEIHSKLCDLVAILGDEST